LVIRRLPKSDPKWFRFPGHAAALEDHFRGHTMLRHLASAESYRRFIRRMHSLFSDARAARAGGDSAALPFGCKGLMTPPRLC
jgi:hypothetical protein